MANKKSNRQRAAQINIGRIKREKKLRQRNADVPVNKGLLAKDASYGIPDFVTRGYYLDKKFECKDCGKLQIWTATQQKWWYETAKGGVWTVARRCRPCRQREQKRVARQRQASEEGRRRKAAGTAKQS